MNVSGNRAAGTLGGRVARNIARMPVERPAVRTVQRASQRNSADFFEMKVRTIIKAAIFGILGLVGVVGSVRFVPSGHRGVRVTAGNMSEEALGEGLQFKLPFFGSIKSVSVRQRTDSLMTDCYSKDLQPIHAEASILWRVPDTAVTALYRDQAAFQGEHEFPFESLFESLVRPRVREALEESLAGYTAEQAAARREEVKATVLQRARQKIGERIVIEDIVLADFGFTIGLKTAIESKMVRDQTAQTARFERRQALIDAATRLIDADGKAKAMVLEAQTLHENPDYVRLLMSQSWDGNPPRIVTDAQGADVLVPLPEKK